MHFPTRKIIRLENYDYSSSGEYFVTICTKNKECILGEIVETTSGRLHMELTKYGNVVEKGINNISLHYKNASCKKYVIMPNHIHMIIEIQNSNGNGRPLVVPTLSQIINQTKGYISKQIGFCIWQARFHEHIIRNEKAYEKICEYIDTNPYKWSDDCYYIK